MSSFARALTLVLQSEGGYVNDPDDPGGETNHGVTARVWAAWCGETGTIPKPMLELTVTDVAELYEARYWRAARCHEMPWPLSLIHFDAAVNCNVSQAAKLLQRALGVNVDGILGPMTMTRTIAAGPRDCLRYLLERVFFYRRIARQTPASVKFLAGGWLKRLEPLYREIT